MNNLIKSIFGTSPRTTIMGYLSAIIAVAFPIIQDGNFDIHKDWKNLVVAVFLAIWGRMQKDSNGITREQSKIVAQMASKGAIPPPNEQDERSIN